MRSRVIQQAAIVFGKISHDRSALTMGEAQWMGRGEKQILDENCKIYKGKSKGGGNSGKKHYVFGDLAGGGGSSEEGADPLNLKM